MRPRQASGMVAGGGDHIGRHRREASGVSDSLVAHVRAVFGSASFGSSLRDAGSTIACRMPESSEARTIRLSQLMEAVNQPPSAGLFTAAFFVAIRPKSIAALAGCQLFGAFVH